MDKIINKPRCVYCGKKFSADSDVYEKDMSGEYCDYCYHCGRKLRK
ncbi:MAG: hypothetical protein MJ170_02890 [Alphaproteobacteria bacterium]|nr:hypothetical protein [Alphaproteobacteria bacterium]